MFRFGKFILAQWHDIKGNAKWWAIVFVFSTMITIFESIKHAHWLQIAAILCSYFAFWTILIWVWFRAWCRREDLREKENIAANKKEGNRLAGETMRAWQREGRQPRKPFKGPR
jgi:hypothetical protein